MVKVTCLEDSGINEDRTMVDVQSTKWKYRRNRRIKIWVKYDYINKNHNTTVYQVSETEERKQKDMYKCIP